MKQVEKIKLLIAIALFGLSVAFFSFGIQEYQILTSSRAEFDGTYCNDNTGNTIPASFSISCGGNTARKFLYVLFWCPNQKAGDSSYCGDIRNLGSAQILDQKQGDVIPGSISSGTDKTCGCVQWDVGVYDANGNIGVAGGELMCSTSTCEEPSPTPQPTTPPNTPVPTTPPNTPVPTTPPNTPQPTTPPNTPVPTTPPNTPQPSKPQNTPTPTIPSGTSVPSNTPVPTSTLVPTNTPVPTATPTVVPTATSTPIPPTPTFTLVPTATYTPVPTFTPLPTFTPQPTYAPQPTYTPQPTYVAQIQPTTPPPQDLTVNEQAPGITPWIVVLIPIGLILVGLLL